MAVDVDVLGVLTALCTSSTGAVIPAVAMNLNALKSSMGSTSRIH